LGNADRGTRRNSSLLTQRWREVDSNPRSPVRSGKFHGSVKVPVPIQGPRSRRISHGSGDRLPSAGSDRLASPITMARTIRTRPAPLIRLRGWKATVLTSMLHPCPLHVFASPLSRSREAAASIGRIQRRLSRSDGDGVLIVSAILACPFPFNEVRAVASIQWRA
jgi:hypothetical protein